jgi:cytochrome c553
MRQTIVPILVLWCALLGRATATGQQVDARARQARQAEMRGHYAQLFAIHDAVVQGDLAALRAPATELAYLSIPVGSPRSMASFGAAIRENARRAADETTLLAAARATTSIIRACAECHRASGASISASAIARRPAGVPERMTDHVRAADDLLLGLLIASDERWNTGADHLASAADRAAEGTAALQSTLRYLSDRARRTDTPAARASTYVQLLTTCADCHQRSRR